MQLLRLVAAGRSIAAAAIAAAVGVAPPRRLPLALPPRCRRSLSSQPPGGQCLYDILGVPPTATIEQLKEAFRARAKALHPDAQRMSGQGAAAAAGFVDLVAAHRVLSDPRTRTLYDASRAAGGSRVLRAAAASGVRGAAAAADGPGGYDDIEVDLSWGLGELLKQRRGTEARAGRAGAVDTLRQELQGELHSAVRRAYLGPRLDALPPGALPDAFEADERSAPDCPHLLQLVSGRQLLGVVSERRLEALARAAAAEVLEGGRAAVAAAAAASLVAALPSASAAAGGAGAAETKTAAAAAPWQQGRDPDVLDLIIGERLVAFGVRHFSPPTPPTSPSTSQGGPEQQHEQQETDGQATAPPNAAAPPPEVVCIYDGGSGELLARVEALQLDPGSATASTARLFNPAGVHTHTVFRTQTPLVRHLTFTAERRATGIRTRRPSKLVVCRARRPWLPPSSLWPFKPRSYDHDIGGWVVEWAGQHQEGHSAWLHPGVLVLSAAFDSLDHERAARQPLGLFGRVRAASATAKAAAGAAGVGAGAGSGGAAGADPGGGTWRSWLASVLRFHGYR